MMPSCLRPVGEQQHVRAGLADVGKREVGAGGALLEQPLPAAQYDWVHHQAVFVDQAVLAQRFGQRGAGEDEDVSDMGALQLGHLRLDVTGDDRGVLPRPFRQRGGHHHLGHGVHLLSVLSGGLLHGRPRGGEALVADPAEQQHVGGPQLLQLPRFPVRGRVAEAPPTLGVTLGAAGVLDDPVQRDELGHDELSHADLRSCVDQPDATGPQRPVPGPIPSDSHWTNVTHGNISPMDVHVSLLGRADLTGEIYRQLRAAIIAGRLRPGDPLPPTRELARRLSVSRGTVAVAYDRLGGEGFVTSRVGAGTFVTGWTARTRPAASTVADALRPRPVWDRIRVSTAFTPPARYEFRTGLPDVSRFPFQTWRQLMAGELRPSAAGRGEYGDPAGHDALRAAIARHLAVSRGLAVSAAQVTVTTGTQQGLDLIARVLAAPGEVVAVEDPGYGPARWLFESLGLDVIGVPVDQHGMIVGALPGTARLVYTTPSHQYPLGTTMSLPRRAALLEWADRHDAAIIEDDYDSEFRYGGRPIEPLGTLDASGRVVYVGSFSK